MPVRFQVDPDFYDHPKTIDLSDAATALWTRAGSYSAAKLLDGFVPEGVLARLSKVPDEASGELVGRGLWRRVRGGFRFHQWDHRNLTKVRIEADREYEKVKKRKQRDAARTAVEMAVDNQADVEPAQLNASGVPPGPDRDSEGTPGGVPPVSVSGSVSMSVSAASSSARETDDPDPAVIAWVHANRPHIANPAAALRGERGNQLRAESLAGLAELERIRRDDETRRDGWPCTRCGTRNHPSSRDCRQCQQPRRPAKDPR